MASPGASGWGSNTTIGGYRRVVGGVRVDVRAEGCRIQPADDPEYAPFTFPRRDPADLSLDVRCGDAPPLPACMPIFRTDAWAMWPLADGGFQLSLLRVREEARATVVSDRRTTAVTYHEAPAWTRAEAGVQVVKDPFRLPVDQVLLVQHLAFLDGLVLHAAGFDFGGAGVVFPGVSGAGKSTLTALLARAIPGAAPLSDERIVVRASAGGFVAWGTPWIGSERVGRNASVPLRAIVLPRQAPEHGIAPLSTAAALRRLMPVVACPFYDAERSVLVLATLEKLLATVPAFELRFARDPGVAAVVEDLLRRDLRAA